MTTEQLVEDLRAVIADAEELLGASAGLTGEEAAAARARIEQTLKDAKERLAGISGAADQFVREHPWQAVGIGAVIGLVLGVLLSRR